MPVKHKGYSFICEVCKRRVDCRDEEYTVTEQYLWSQRWHMFWPPKTKRLIPETLKVYCYKCRGQSFGTAKEDDDV